MELGRELLMSHNLAQKVNLPIVYSDKPVTPYGGMALMKRFVDRVGIRDLVGEEPKNPTKEQIRRSALRDEFPGIIGIFMSQLCIRVGRNPLSPSDFNPLSAAD